MLQSGNPKTTRNLSIGYHNIGGKHSSLHGCKINNHLKLINDIEILAETWAECDNCKNNIVKNYQLLKHIEPQKTKGCKKGRKSGGDPTLLQILLKIVHKNTKILSHSCLV